MELPCPMPNLRQALTLVTGLGLLLAAMPIGAQSRSQVEQVQQQRTFSSSPTPGSQSTPSAATSAAPGQYEPDEIGPGNRAVTSSGPATPRSERVQARPGEFELFVSELAGKQIRRLGSELLVPEARDFMAPPTTAIPPDYRINPGDEIVLGLTGTVQASNLRLVVDQNGRIFVPQIGAVNVGGVAYHDLQAAIASRVSRQYQDFAVSVTIGSLHGITVYVTGFAASPGSYTVNSISTVVNAVLAAGGPSAGGSFRSIQVRRGGRLVSDFDLYDFLLKGDKSDDIVLQNGDVLFIAPAGAQVAAIGSVNSEAIYEARASDTLNDILLYAGGANTVADLTRLHVFDPQSEEGWQEIPPGQALVRTAKRGEILRVLSGVGIAQPVQRMQSLVTISGEVAKPGRYFVKPGTTLDDVIAMAGGLTPEAYAFGAVFVRDKLRRDQQISFAKAIGDLRLALTAEPLVSATARQGDMASRLAAVNSVVEQLQTRRIEGRLVMEVGPDARALPGSFVVENNDSLHIPPRNLAVGVYGMVNSSADFRYKPGVRIGDYVQLAGGFTRIADKKHVFVVRVNGTLLSGRSVANAEALPGDLVFVPVDADRGAFWARLHDVVSAGFQGALTAATAVAVTK